MTDTADAATTIDFAELSAPPRTGETQFTWMPGERTRVYVANVFIGVMGAVAIIFAITTAVRATGEGRPVTAVADLVVGALAALLIAGAILRAVLRRRRWGVRAPLLGPRLPAFALANALEHQRESTAIRVPIVEARPDYRVIDRRVRDRLRSDHGGDAAVGAFELGDFIWTVDHGGGQKGIGTYLLAYVAVRMPRALPLIVLQSTQPGAGEYLAHPDQILELEGDWGRYFTLYCPAGYERDALQIITPDVMAAMVDRAQPWTAAVLGDWLVFIASRPFARARVDQYRSAFRLVEVARQFREQAEHYSDARAASGGAVAPEGTRLRGRASPLAFLAIGVPLVLMAAFALIPIVTGGA